MIIRDILERLKIIVVMTLFLIFFLIMVPVIILKTIKIEAKSNENEVSKIQIEEREEDIIVKGNNIAKIYNVDTKSVEELDVEEYIKCVIASEMPANFEIEALKAQAVAARTYYYARRNENCNLYESAEICNSVHCQSYKSKEECCSSWNENSREKYWNKINQAVEETKNEVLIYEGEIVKYPQYFSTSWGKTENAVDVFSSNVPYLKSTDSLGEDEAPKYSSKVEISIKEFVSNINTSYNTAELKEELVAEQVQILSNTSAGAVKEIKIGNTVISGTKFRSLFNLNSANFTVGYDKDKVIINCIGYGHGVGMSQWGANIMAREGIIYKDILKHYYTGITIGKVILNK